MKYQYVVEDCGIDVLQARINHYSALGYKVTSCTPYVFNKVNTSIQAAGFTTVYERPIE